MNTFLIRQSDKDQVDSHVMSRRDGADILMRARMHIESDERAKKLLMDVLRQDAFERWEQE